METSPKVFTINKDCLEALKDIPDNSIDSVVTDPPYELGFMGRKWDKTGIAYNVNMWKEVLRVLKPGGHLLSFGATKTYHRMACAIEDAGFEIRDCIQWIYGSGMPHGDNISKRIDKMQGAKRGKVRMDISQVRNTKAINGGYGVEGGDRPYMQKALEVGYHELDDNNPVTEDAKKWNGWNTALKPANEPIVVAQKPLAEKGYAANVLKYGTGALNIDSSRIYASPEDIEKARVPQPVFNSDTGNVYNMKTGIGRNGEFFDLSKGRWPANVIFDEEAAQTLDEQTGVTKSGFSSGKRTSPKTKNTFGNWELQDEKPFGYGDSGGASRFFYVAKAHKSEKGDFNNHPTVKPLKLMEYLVTLVTPPNGVVLDPFMGSGTTGVAALNKGFQFRGIEKDSHSYEIAQKRIIDAKGKLYYVNNGWMEPKDG